jgi:hypothetical protein
MGGGQRDHADHAPIPGRRQGDRGP